MSSVPFTFDLTFEAEGKAADGPGIASEIEDGDLIIEGWGLNFDVDRQGEAFEDDGVLQKALDAFVAGEAALCYHHKHDHVLGKVLDARVVPGKGVHIRARVDGTLKESPMGHLYHQIRRGTLKALSFGGFFQRKVTPAGPRINDADFTELSVTAVPVGRGPSFAVVAGKALEDLTMPKVPKVAKDSEIRQQDEDMILMMVQELNHIFTRIESRGKKKVETSSSPSFE